MYYSPPKNNIVKFKRNTAELKSKLHQLFQDNIADYEKFADWYDDSKPTINVLDKAEYEHNVVENYKKLIYGDSYEVKEFRNKYFTQ